MAVSNLFNAGWYLQQNPDVAEAVQQGLLTAQEHFTLFGNTEGRSPGPLFNTHDYLAGNPDVADAVAAGLISAYDHFQQFGGAEGRSTLSLFDADFYLAQNPDVAAAVAAGLTTAIQHFLMFGHGEPRQINPFINLADYLGVNPDLSEAAGQEGFSAFSHLLTYGMAEGRDLGNGLNLADFANDPGFTEAIANNNFQGALERVQDVAPFLSSFVPPQNWETPADTPIPMDFVPPEGVLLVIPPSVEVPPDTELPPSFEPIPAPTPGGGGGGEATFTLTHGGEADGTGTITFNNAHGAITLTVNDAGFLVFTDAAATVQTSIYKITDMADGGIPAVTLSATTFATDALPAKLADNTATINATDATSCQLNGLVTGDDVQPQITAITHLSLDLQSVKDADANTLLTKASGGAVVQGSDTDNTITGSVGNDIIRGGRGKDTLVGDNGNDTFVLVGITASKQYDDSDIPDDIKSVLTLDTLNGNSISEAVSGESYDGGGGDNTLHIYGTVDMQTINLNNIKNIVVHSDVTFTSGQLDNITSISGDGGSTVRLAAGEAAEIDLSGITLSNLGQLDVGDNVTAVLSQNNINAITTVSSGFQSAKIKAAADSLDFTAKNVFGSADIQNSDGDNKSTLRDSSNNDVGKIITDVNAIISSVNATLTEGGLNAYQQKLAVEEEYSLICDVLAGMTGASMIQGRAEVQNFISGGDGSDTLIGGSNETNFIYVGTEETGQISNTVMGGAARDFISGHVNNDTIDGSGGNDFIYGDAGNDTIYGQGGTDFIRPGEGADTVYIHGSSDFLDLTEDTAAQDTIVFLERPDEANPPSYILGFNASDTGADKLEFREEVFISGDNGDKSVVGTGSSAGKFALDTADFSGLVKITDQADINFANAGTIIGNAVTGGTADDAFIFAVSDGTSTMLLGWDDRKASGGNSNGQMDANEVTQIAVLIGVNNVTGIMLSLELASPG